MLAPSTRPQIEGKASSFLPIRGLVPQLGCGTRAWGRGEQRVGVGGAGVRTAGTALRAQRELAKEKEGSSQPAGGSAPRDGADVRRRAAGSEGPPARTLPGGATALRATLTPSPRPRPVPQPRGGHGLYPARLPPRRPASPQPGLEKGLEPRNKSAPGGRGNGRGKAYGELYFRGQKSVTMWRRIASDNE